MPRNETGFAEIIAITCHGCGMQWLAMVGREEYAQRRLREHSCAADLQDEIDDLRSRIEDLEG